jgi:bifunctional DNA-binding transcriptional regulator/antitoxin component of YhaV-PrlF toxin-antitoxin module
LGSQLRLAPSSKDAVPSHENIAGNAVLHYNQMWNMRSQVMTILTVTARGQVTFRKDVLQHLGIRPGEKIELDKLPDGRISLKAMRPSGKIDSFLGLLAGKTRKVATIDEIDEAAAAGWAGQK